MLSDPVPQAKTREPAPPRLRHRVKRTVFSGLKFVHEVGTFTALEPAAVLSEGVSSGTAVSCG